MSSVGIIHASDREWSGRVDMLKVIINSTMNLPEEWSGKNYVCETPHISPCQMESCVQPPGSRLIMTHIMGHSLCARHSSVLFSWFNCINSQKNTVVLLSPQIFIWINSCRKIKDIVYTYLGTLYLPKHVLVGDWV